MSDSNSQQSHRPAVAAPEKDRIYPCQRCGMMRTAAEGGTIFTVCDACWGAGSQPGAVDHAPIHFEGADRCPYCGDIVTVCRNCVVRPCGKGAVWAAGYSAGISTLRAQLDEALIALRAARDELGVPQPGYPAPVANAANIIASALSKIGSES